MNYDGRPLIRVRDENASNFTCFASRRGLGIPPLRDAVWVLLHFAHGTGVNMRGDGSGPCAITGWVHFISGERPKSERGFALGP